MKPKSLWAVLKKKEDILGPDNYWLQTQAMVHMRPERKIFIPLVVLTVPTIFTTTLSLQ